MKLTKNQSTNLLRVLSIIAGVKQNSDMPPLNFEFNEKKEATLVVKLSNSIIDAVIEGLKDEGFDSTNYEQTLYIEF